MNTKGIMSYFYAAKRVLVTVIIIALSSTAAVAASAAAPVIKMPVITKPVIKMPAINTPVIKIPATNKPVIKMPAIKIPAIEKPVIKKPATKKPATKKPATKKPATKKPAIKKPAIKMQAINKPVIKMPAINKPVIKMPVIEKPVKVGNMEAADSNKDAGGKDEFRMGELQTGSKDAKEATTDEPSLQNKEQLSFDGPKIEAGHHVEEHLSHSKLEEIEGLERMESSLLDDVMSERSAETERYGKIERDSLMSEHSNPNRIVGDINDVDLFQSPANDVSENDVRSADGNGMASDGESKGFFYKLFDAVGNSKIPLVSTAAKVTNALHNELMSTATSNYRERWFAFAKDPANHPAPSKADKSPAPDGTGSDTSLPTSIVREAVAKFYGQYGQQPWVGTAGQPVPDDDGGTPFDFAAASEVFSQLARQDWNPMIVQPGPDGDMEHNYLGMKELPGDLGFMKLQMAGQPVPDDPDWGTGDGGKGPSYGGNINPQPVTTQRPAAAAESRVDAEAPQKKE